MSEPVANSLYLPDNAHVKVRQSLGLGISSPLRIAFIAGPGDVVGTFDQWVHDCHDTRTPVIAYSTMFFSLVAALQAEAIVLVEHDRSPSASDPRFRFVHTAHQRGRRGLGYHLDEAAFARTVLDELATWPADVILVGTDAPAGLIARLPRRARIVLTAHNIYWPMGQRPTNLKARVRLWQMARALGRVHSAVCTSRECANQIVSLGRDPERMFVETPQVLEKFFTEVRCRTGCVRLLYLGRIEIGKGILDLIDAFNVVAADLSEITLEIAGTGSADSAVRARVNSSVDPTRIKVHGLLAAQEVHALLAECDLLICPTRTESGEGLALVVIEAATHGVPSVVSSIVPAQDLLPGGCIAFPADDTNAMIACLRELTANPSVYSALCAAIEPARAQFRDRSASWGSMLYRAML